MRHFGVRHNHSKELRGYLFIQTGCFLVTVTAVLVHEISLPKHDVVNFTWREALCVNLIYLSIKNYTATVISLNASYNVRLKQISRLLKTSSDDKFKTLEKLKVFRLLLQKFCDSVRLGNKCLSLSYVLSIVDFSFRSIFIIFNLYNVLMKEKFPFFLAAFIFTLVDCVFVLSLMIQSSVLKSEGENLSVAINNAHLFAMADIETLKSIHLTAAQFEHQSLMVSCGLFSIDYKFLFALISSIFSYIIVLIQFDSA